MTIACSKCKELTVCSCSGIFFTEEGSYGPEIVPMPFATPFANIYMELMKCPAYYIMSFSDGCFSYEEKLQCYEPSCHTDAHKTRLASYSEDGGIICWNNTYPRKQCIWCVGDNVCMRHAKL